MRLRGGDSDEEVSGSMEEDDDGDGVEIDIKEIKVDRPDYVMERHEFNHVIRVLNTNIDGTRTVVYALTKVKGVGRRFGHAVVTRAGIDASKRAGQLSAEEIERLVQVIENPSDYDIPAWMFNRRKDWESGKDMHNVINKLDLQIRQDHDRMRKMRLHRGLRHAWGFKVRGQHTKTTGRGRKVAGAVKASNKPAKKK